MANALGRGSANLLLKYLGVPVGCNMARCSNWDSIIQKFSSKLTQWNAWLLSVGGHLSLIKSVLGSLSTYYMSLYKVPVSICNKLDSMQNHFFIGGDLGLLFKWIWRVLNHLYDLWANVIKEIHGLNEGIFNVPTYSSCHSPWSGTLSSVKSFKLKGIDLLSLCIQKLRNGASIRFWDDIWCGTQPLKAQFPRVFMLDNDKSCYIANRLSLPDWTSILRM
nr:hypothetical protein [Tanacetum cinerariifolium]GFA96539.1 hypothetical protein [Tanacetum cinerariifolium]